MITSDDIARLGDIPPAEILDLPLASGDDVADSLWKNFINTRLRVDGDHVFLKTRGGSASVDTFSSQILTLYPFATTIAATQKTFIAVHCDDGDAYIYDVGADAQTLMFDGVFSTTNQVEFIHNGLFLYIFDSDTETYKFYDLENDNGYDWMGDLGGSITDVSWLTGKWTDDTMWDLHEGKSILVEHNFIEGKYVDPLTSDETHRAFQTKVDSVYTTYFNYSDPAGKTYRSNENGSLMGFGPAAPDILEDYDRYPSLYEIDENGDSVDNNDYKIPFIYKGYIVVDLMADGNYLTTGRPITLLSSLSDINSNRRVGAELTVAAPASGVVKRYLFATRWQTSTNNVYNPSRETYSNSAFFLVKPIDINQTTVRDVTPDSQLLEGLSSFLPITAGVLQMFGPAQLVPNTVSVARSTLLIGGYRIDRPTPQLYTDAGNSAQKNIFWDQVVGGTNLTGSPELAFQFEYTDGKKSAIVDTGEILTDAEEDDIIDPGQVATEAESEKWEVTEVPSGSGDVTIEYPYNEYEEETVTAAYNNGDSIQDIVNAVVNAVNADGNIQLTADPFDTATKVGFTEKRTGADHNGNTIRITYAPHPNSPELLTMSGGTSAVTEEKRTGNRLQIHSLNALVAKIFILATETVDPYVDYRLLREIEVSEPGFHGKTIYLPNNDTDFDATPEYITPPATDQRESVDLPGYMVPAVPFQQPRINEQKPLEGAVRIGKLIPWRFDTDKSQLRFQVVAFTETNIQLGYLSFNQGGAFSLDASFEVILEGLRATSFEGIANVAGNVFFPGDRYMYGWNGRDLTPLFDVNRYPVSASNNPIDVVYNQSNGEAWIIYDSQDVVVVNLADNSVRRMNFDNIGNLKAAGYYGGNLYLGGGSDVVETDLTSQDYDLLEANVVEGVLQSRHLGTPPLQSKILEVVVGGQDGTAELDIDLQPQRKEGNETNWPDSFTSAQNYAAKTLYIHGASFNVKRRAVMPRLQITLKSGFIEYIQIRHVQTENRGIARKS